MRKEIPHLILLRISLQVSVTVAATYVIGRVFFGDSNSAIAVAPAALMLVGMLTVLVYLLLVIAVKLGNSRERKKSD